MRYLIDTNIAIHAFEMHEGVLRKLTEYNDSVFLSVLTVVELVRGVSVRPALAATRQAQLNLLLKAVPVLPFDEMAAGAYACIIAKCGWVRARDFDRMLAAHAMSTGSILVTGNGGDFRDIEGLKTENWVAEPPG